MIDSFIGFLWKDPVSTGNLQGRLSLHDMYQASQIDIAFLGSSNIYSAIDPFMLEEKLNDQVSVFDAATSSAVPIDSYYYLKELLRIGKKPDIVFVDVFYPGYQNSVFYDNPEHSIYLYDYLKLSWNKAAYFMDTFEEGDKIFALFNARRYLQDKSPGELLRQAAENTEIKLFSSWYREYAPYGNDKGEYAGKGYRYLPKGIEPGMMGTQIYLPWDEDNVNDDAVEYLNRMYELCEEEGIEIILISPPLAATSRIGMGNYESVHEFFQKIADERGIEFWDFNYAKSEMIALEDNDFYDQHHLSKSGAEKFTDAVAAVLKLDKEERRDCFWEQYNDVAGQYVQVAGVSIERDDTNHLLRANSIQEKGIQVTYEFYGSDDRKDYRLLKRSEDNTIALEEADCRYIKVAAYNPDLNQQRIAYWEIELSDAGKGEN